METVLYQSFIAITIAAAIVLPVFSAFLNIDLSTSSRGWGV